MADLQPLNVTLIVDLHQEVQRLPFMIVRKSV